jgi:hypothetical protein
MRPGAIRDCRGPWPRGSSPSWGSPTTPRPPANQSEPSVVSRRQRQAKARVPFRPVSSLLRTSRVTTTWRRWCRGVHWGRGRRSGSSRSPASTNRPRRRSGSSSGSMSSPTASPSTMWTGVPDRRASTPSRTRRTSTSSSPGLSLRKARSSSIRHHRRTTDSQMPSSRRHRTTWPARCRPAGGVGDQ